MTSNILINGEVAGDCGAWVIDAESGNLYGHIVAGDSFLHRAYVVQITDVINDIQTKMHESVHLPNLKGSEGRCLMTFRLPFE